MNLKHIKTIEDLKPEYLYELKDHIRTEIILLKEVNQYIEGDRIYPDKRLDYFKMELDIVSIYLIQNNKFDLTKYQFLEIGPKEDHPEYLL